MAMTFRPSEELARELADQAKREGVSVQQLVVTSCCQYLDRNRRKATIDEAMDAITGRYGTVLRRLGEGA